MTQDSMSLAWPQEEYTCASFAPSDTPQHTPPVPQRLPGPAILQSMRYSDRPIGWRTRLAGMGGTTGFFLILAAATFVTWHAARPEKARPEPLVVSLQPLAAPQEPAQEVPEGPQRIEQKKQETTEPKESPEPPLISPPQVSRDAPFARQPVEQSRTLETVQETTAPKSIPAPPAQRASSNAEAAWEATLLAHLEKYRRYPATARARREQGVAHVQFRMNRQGKLLSARILRSSGSALLDRAALDTLRRAQPLPAIPADKADLLELSVPVEFFIK